MKPLSLKERMLIESGFMPPLKKSDGDDVPDIERSVGVLVVKDGKILCGVRAKGSNTGLICGPGGHVKQGESYEQAAFRETEEEFGISPRALFPLGFGPKEPDTGMAPAIFLCTDYDGEPYSNDREMALPCFCSMGELGTLSGAGMLFQPFKDGLEVMIQCLETGNPNISEKPLDKSAQSVTIKSRETSEDGGPGSGNHGHKGVPGRIGGSAPSASAKGPNKPCTGFKDAAAVKRHKKHWAEFGFTSHEQYEKAAIEFLRKPIGGDIDGYARSDGCVVRFNVKTCELAFGYPRKHIKSYYIAKYDSKTGKPNATLANNYFNEMKKAEADEEG